MPPVVNRLIMYGELRAVAIKHMVKLSLIFFLSFFFLREKLVMYLSVILLSNTVKIQYIAVCYFTKSSISRISHGSQIFHKQKNLKT